MKPLKILTVSLPCQKVYPLGPIYLMATLMRGAPASPQRLLDLSLVRPGQRAAVLQGTVLREHPDVVAFSWRDIQLAPAGLFMR